MKKATPKSSPNYRSSKYSKSKTGHKSKANDLKASVCLISIIDEQVVQRALQSGAALDQYNIVVCPDGHEHEIDISPFIEKLRKAGHNIVQNVEVWKGDCPLVGKGNAMNMVRVYSYINTDGSAAND